ncbi:MAG: transketolase C-terminal domain-containing protein [Myxococcota bacterium]
MTYEELLEDISKRDDRLIVMTAENRAVIRNLPPKLGGRFIDTGITEMTQIGMAAGLALRGRVVLTHALATFLTMRAFEFIRTDVGIPRLPVKIVGGFPGFLSAANGATHQAIEDIALMRGIPNMHVFCPADDSELLDAMPKIIDDPNPCYIRFNNSNPIVKHEPFEIGRAETIKDGKDVCILTYGFLLEQAVEASRQLEAQGISARVINMKMLAPFDRDIILAAASETRLLVTVEDHFHRGGLYSIVAELLFEAGQTSKVLSIDLEDRWYRPALLNDVLEHEGFTGAKIAKKITEWIR